MPAPESPAPESPVARSPDRRYRFFAGKGGVGKTTCAAAVAVTHAEAGVRVLAVSTDPAHSLGDAFGRRLTARPRRISATPGMLDAVEVDADAALARWLRGRRPELGRIVSRGTYLDDEDIEHLLRLALPGVDELMGLLELRRLAGSGDYEEVVVDTAPTGHTLRLLAMPATLGRVADILDDMQAKHRFLAESLGGRYRPDAADRVIEELRAESLDSAALLRDPARSAFGWVLLPEPMALEEARDGVAVLEEAGIGVQEIIVNRITPAPLRSCQVCDSRRLAEGIVIAEARRTFHPRPLRLLPAVEREPRGVRALRAFGRRLASERSAAGPVVGSSRPVRAPRRALPRNAGGVGAWLESLVPRGSRLVLLAGKGGVGKTTCAAALGVGLADRAPGKRVLLLSTDPAHSLGDVLGVRLNDDVTPAPGVRGLVAREVDARRMFEARRTSYLAAVDEMFAAARGGSRFDPVFDRVVVEKLIDLSPPGIDELFSMVSIVDAVRPPDGSSAPYDMVVVDTAPTGHALRLLQMPEAVLAWVHVLMGILLKYRKIIGLGELGAELLSLSRDLRQLRALLADRGRTRVIAVTRAAELPRLETRRLVSAFAKLGIGLAGVVVNAATPPGCARCRRRRAAEARVVGALRSDLRSLRCHRCAIIQAPAMAPPPRGPGALAGWLGTWTPIEA